MPDLAQTPALWFGVAYFVAAIPVGLLIAKAKGIDLRAVGSGNIGATNAVRALGRGWGLPVFFLDVAKAASPVWVASQPWALGSHAEARWMIAAVGLAAVLGHIFPIYLRFRGGKGVACALGVFAVLQPWSAAACTLLYLQTLVLTRISAVGSLTGVSALTLFVLVGDCPDPDKALALVMAPLIWWRHRGNLGPLISEGKQRARKSKANVEREVDENQSREIASPNGDGDSSS